jgi:hypothetical protein
MGNADEGRVRKSYGGGENEAEMIKEIENRDGPLSISCGAPPRALTRSILKGQAQEDSLA